MNGLVYHIASGHAFFTGIALVLFAVIASTRQKPIWNRISLLSCLIGGIAILISSTAIPYWIYGAAILSTLAWGFSKYFKSWRPWAGYVTIVIWLIAAALEIPYHITPRLKLASLQSIAVIGDSITAGIGGDDKSITWPTLLADQHHLTVQDISHMGDTAASALKRAKQHEISAPVVILEIGGNDLLGSTSSVQFEKDLDALLEHLSENERQIVMFELPLPPFCHEFGRIQRSLASKHHVSLIPKRVLLSVIAGNDSTLDSIHLTQSGHNKMAACVWNILSPTE